MRADDSQQSVIIRVVAAGAEFDSGRQSDKSVAIPTRTGEAVSAGELLACFQLNATAHAGSVLPRRFFRTIHAVGTTGKPNT